MIVAAVFIELFLIPVVYWLHAGLPNAISDLGLHIKTFLGHHT